jgi:UDP-N-acetylglucosamine 3-dehydrogenase
MDKVRVAVVGAGGIGGAHLKAYADWPDLCEIVAVADIHLAAAEERVQNYGGAAYQDYIRMLDEVRPDAVSICTPPNLHLPIVEAAAARRIAVLCEKPPARTLAETQAIVAAMEQSGSILQFAFCHRFHRSVVQAQELIASGKLGRVVQIYNRFGFHFGRASQSWFTDAGVAGGGVLIDTLVHSVDIFRSLAGEVVSVSASISTSLPGISVEDSASMLVTSESGVIGTLTCSWVTPVSEAEIRIYGSEGQAVIDYAQPDGLRYKLAGDTEWTQLPFDTAERFTLQAEHFLNVVRTQSTPAITGQDGIAVMQVIEAAYQSAAASSQPVAAVQTTPWQ